MPVPMSVLDLAPINRGQTVGESIAASVALAQHAEESGYRRVWYAEHHNMPSIASSATSVLIAHVGAHTREIRLGAGGVMLPNHSPLTIAEQFGTLEAMYPGRIDLGLGRAPGSDQNTHVRAAPRPEASDTLPAGRARAAGLPRRRVPGDGRRRHPRQGVPRAAVRARLLAVRRPAGRRARPALRLRLALRARRRCRRPSRPTAREFQPVRAAGRAPTSSPGSTWSPPTPPRPPASSSRSCAGCAARRPVRPRREYSDEVADQLLAAGAGRHVDQMLTHAAVGTPAEVREYLEGFARARRTPTS